MVIAINDLMAIGLILELQAAGYRVPEDVAVLGYDNIPEATIVRPALTTIAQDPRDMDRSWPEPCSTASRTPIYPGAITKAATS